MILFKNTRLRNAIILGIFCLCLLMMLLPGFYTAAKYGRHLESTPTGFTYYAWYVRDVFTTSFVETYGAYNYPNTAYMILTTLILAVTVACIVIFAIQVFVGKKLTLVGAVASFVSLVLFCIYTPIMNACCNLRAENSAYLEYWPSGLFYTVLSLLVLAVAYAVFGFVTEYLAARNAPSAGEVQ